MDDGALTPGYAMYLKKIFAKNDLDIAVLGCYLNLANPDEGQLAKITHRYLAHIRFASLLGVGILLNRTGLTQVRKHRTMIRTLFYGS